MSTRRATVIARIITLAFILKVSAFNPPLVGQTRPSPTGGQSPIPETVRTVDFCKLIKQPYHFMNQMVRITAKWEIVGQNQYLDGIHCRAEYIERLGTIFAGEQNETIKWNVSRVQSREFDGRAKITVVGAMRDPTRGEGPALKFEILRFEDIAPLERVRDSFSAGQYVSRRYGNRAMSFLTSTALDAQRSFVMKSPPDGSTVRIQTFQSCCRANTVGERS